MSCATGLLLEGVPGVNTISPWVLPRKAFLPCGSNTNELGALGRTIRLPIRLSLVVMGRSAGWQLGIGMPAKVQVEVTYTVPVLAVPVMVPVITFEG